MIDPDTLVIGLGGNVGHTREVFERARWALNKAYPKARSAGLYRTAPIGPAQDDFLNSAVAVRVPDTLVGVMMEMVLDLERLLGRERRGATRWGPRVIDLDLLVWGERIIHMPGLELPHPRIAQRRFVLRPLRDLFGDELVLPGQTKTLAELEESVGDQQIELVTPSW